MKQSSGLFENITTVSEAARLAFIAKLEEIKAEKGFKMEREGQVSNHLYYISEGSARSFYIRENRDITVSFSLEGEFVTAMHSFITRKPSYETIETLEKSILYRISHKDLQDSFEEFPEMERAYRMILEKYYIALEERQIFTKFKSARDRYLELMDNKPKIIQKASVGQIASFLDMTIETLSRIRAKI
ncbi:Crp/Fnr family transcriptional regulator [Algoriphagus hitonicola]|uniref:cAMP-binding domain of CRP or a regulatory subunit of cAMP-dependent protein kinases n=1 Tax=Algoriphagus hitonicola TaxID=435880 RepID=A0A1I2V9S0_9BACT|nr:Crp/Fnr family transcriptional regulator [Algoriphagus hitonicola]SFG85199.1 cAMP-binding domain of CRP or a regulatory subunit of cAMP-dependent protein kinases [Algoriphagus hitonicola]